MSENLGFLTVIDQSPSGLTGGYLVLNKAGRPLEFHCTMPISPEKIQKILYGDMLLPFLYGERIAQTLINRSKLPVFSVLTNHADILPVQSLVSTPIIYVFGDLQRQEGDVPLDGNTDSAAVREISPELSESLKTFGIDNANLRTRSSCPDDMPKVPHVPGFDTGLWREVRIGNRLIAVPEMETFNSEQLFAEIKSRARTIDLFEPFTRIRLALEEAKNAA
jgi:hypothetical protein